MFIDASALVALVGREPGWEELAKRLAEQEGQFFVSPLVRFEASLALARKKSGGQKPSPAVLRQAARTVEAFIEDIVAQEIEISPEIGNLALETSATYGKAVGHIADLNFGDCFAYACAKTLNSQLLYKGDDFAHTDLA